MKLATKLALKIPQIRRLWDERNRLARSAEEAQHPQSPFWHYQSSFDAVETMTRYAVSAPEPHPMYLTNFLGVRIDPKFFPGLLDGRHGAVEPIPIPANWHADIAEWAAALRAVDLSGDIFRAVELGCGWGCWLNNTGAAARSVGKRVDLIGIEGDETHLGFANEAMSTNDFTAAEYSLRHGVAAPRSGKALFPIVDVPGAIWGSAPILDATSQQINEARRGGGYQILDAVTLPELVGDRPIDLLHIDIQGGETDFVRDNLEALNSLVRYIVIGTHSRQIEGDLMRILLGAGWLLEMERTAVIRLHQGIPETVVDGVQGWRSRGQSAV